jgi:hypothetical protein
MDISLRWRLNEEEISETKDYHATSYIESRTYCILTSCEISSMDGMEKTTRKGHKLLKTWIPKECMMLESDSNIPLRDLKHFDKIICYNICEDTHYSFGYH